MSVGNLERYPVLDAFKFLGALGVVLIHANSLFAPSHAVLYDTLNLVARAIVPVFFMLSGYFLERRRTQDAQPIALWRSAIWRLGLPFVVWSALYLIIPANWPAFLMSDDTGTAYASWMQEVHTNHFSKRIPITLLLAGGKNHLWFLSALMFGVTASLILRKFMRPAHVLSIAAFIYMLGLILAPYRDTLIGIKINWGTHDGKLSLSYVGLCIGFLYFELGGLIYRQRDKLPSARAAFFLMIAGLILTLVEGAWLHMAHGLAIKEKFYLLGTIPYSLGVFLLLLQAKNVQVAPWLASCGRYSLGIYALHLLLLDAIKRNMTAPESLLASFAIVIAVFVTTTAIILALGRIQALRPILS